MVKKYVLLSLISGFLMLIGCSSDVGEKTEATRPGEAIVDDSAKAYAIFNLESEASGSVGKSTISVEQIRIDSVSIKGVLGNRIQNATWTRGQSNDITMELSKGSWHFEITDSGVNLTTGQKYSKINMFDYTFSAGFSYVIKLIVGLDFSFSVDAGTIDLSKVENWLWFERISRFSILYPGLVLTIPDGVRFKALQNGIWWRSDRYRGGGHASTQAKYDLKNTTVEIIWTGSGGGTFDQILLHLGEFNDVREQSQEIYLTWLSYGNSWDNTTVINENVVYKTVVEFSDGDFVSKTYDSNGMIVAERTGSVDLSKEYYLAMRHGDNYMYMNSYLEIMEAKIIEK